MRSVWAVARQTFAQCLRMRVAGLFIVLLAGALAAMPLLIQGESGPAESGGTTLASRIRTFLSYSVSLTGMLLILVTVFLSVAVISDDVRTKQIFSIATKPLPRWQYVVGRWAGVVLLNALLLAAAGAAIYAVAQSMRARSAINPGDRRTVETEIFTARERVPPDPIDERVAQAVQARIEALRGDGRFESTLEGFVAQADGDAEAGLAAMMEEIHQQERRRLQSAGPGESIQWTFSGIDAAGQTTAADGEIAEVSREAGMVRVRAPNEVLGPLVYGGPVRINRVEGRVTGIGRDFFDAQLDLDQPGVSDLDAGETVGVEVDPMIQLSYKLVPPDKPASGVLRSAWFVTNPPFYQEMRSDPPDRQVSLTLSTRLLATDEETGEGELKVRYTNLPVSAAPADNVSVTVPRENIAVLYPVGGFEGNFVRALGLILVQVAFLAAVGVLAGSFLSFAVGCLVTFMFLPFSVAREFLVEAVRRSPGISEPMDPIIAVGHYVVKVMTFLLPDFSSTDASQTLVRGMFLPWTTLGASIGLNVVLRGGLVLLLACLIFQRRELARVQV